MELAAARSYETKCLMWFSFSFFSSFFFFSSSDFVQMRMYMIDCFKKVFWWTASVLKGLMQLLFASG